jgi:uncharacterized SAM-binding protein YcdF (DUF218 family)
MIFIFSKIFNFLTSPINWILILVLLFFLIKGKRWKQIILIFTLLLSFVFTNKLLYIKAVNNWSAPYKNPIENNQVYDLAIIAGGAVDYSQDWGQLDFNERADRITEAIRLYRLGKIKKMLMSGESAFNIKNGVSYAPEFLQYMKEMGVHPSDIILEQKARSTAENVAFLTEMLKDSNPETPILLITSGWHMRRTLKGFEDSGLNLIPYAVDVHGFPAVLVWTDFLPSWKAAQDWQKLIHEIVGILII